MRILFFFVLEWGILDAPQTHKRDRLIGNFSPSVFLFSSRFLNFFFFLALLLLPPPPLQSVKVGCRRVMEVVQRQQRKQSRWALQLWGKRGEGNQPGWCDRWRLALNISFLLKIWSLYSTHAHTHLYQSCNIPFSSFSRVMKDEDRFSSFTCGRFYFSSFIFSFCLQ